MSRYKPIGVSLLPERIAMIDKRAEMLGLSRSKYLQALVDADTDAGLLDCTIDAKGGQPVVKVREGVNVVVLDKNAVESMSVGIIVQAMKTLGDVNPQLNALLQAGNVRKAAQRAVKQK